MKMNTCSVCGVIATFKVSPKDHNTEVHWHIMTNIPGCLPDGEIRIVDTPELRDSVAAEVAEDLPPLYVVDVQECREYACEWRH